MGRGRGEKNRKRAKKTKAAGYLERMPSGHTHLIPAIKASRLHSGARPPELHDPPRLAAATRRKDARL